MNWLIIIVVVVIVVFIISKISGESTDDSLATAAGAGVGCGYIVLQIFLALLGIWLLFKIGSFLFG